MPRDEVENILELNVGGYLARETIMPDQRVAIILSARALPKLVQHFPTEYNVDDLVVHIRLNQRLY